MTLWFMRECAIFEPRGHIQKQLYIVWQQQYQKSAAPLLLLNEYDGLLFAGCASRFVSTSGRGLPHSHLSYHKD